MMPPKLFRGQLAQVSSRSVLMHIGMKEPLQVWGYVRLQVICAKHRQLWVAYLKCSSTADGARFMFF